MPHYPGLNTLLLTMTAASAEAALSNEVVPLLVDAWLRDYARLAKANDIVETTVEGFTYLFDLAEQRLLAAWGISRGRQGRKRDDPDDHARLCVAHAFVRAAGGGIRARAGARRGVRPWPSDFWRSSSATATR